MGMASPPRFPRIQRLLSIVASGAPSGGRSLREFSRHNVAVIRTVEFGLVLACMLAAATAGGDMLVIQMILVCGWVLSVFGLFSSNLSRNWIITLICVISLVLFGEWYILYSHFHPANIQLGKDIRELTNQELVGKSLAITKRMRNLQDDAWAKSIDLTAHKQPGAFEIHQKAIKTFLDEIRPEARVIAVEVLRREGLYPPYPVELQRIDGWLSLMEGFIAGPKPVGDAANFLEDFTRRLPQ